MPAKRARAHSPCRSRSNRVPGQIREDFEYQHYAYPAGQDYIPGILRLIRFNATRKRSKCAG